MVVTAIQIGSDDRALNDERQSRKRLRKLVQKEIESTYHDIKGELDEHREAINESTNELQSNQGYMQLLEQKIERIAERVDAIARAVRLSDETAEPLQRVELSDRETDLFLLLYTAPAAMSYHEIAGRMLTSEFLVGSYVAALIEKGIPVAKRYISGCIYVALESSFKEQQAKYSIVKLVKEGSLLAYIGE